MSDYLHTTSHDFKSNFSRYLKRLMAGEYEGVLIKHYTKPIGIFTLLEPPSPQKSEEPEDEQIDMKELVNFLKNLD